MAETVIFPQSACTEVTGPMLQLTAEARDDLPSCQAFLLD